jgi:thiol-disulfide isomerase/thioredoxin
VAAYVIVLVFTVVAGLAVVIFLPRVMMAKKMAKLNDAPAPTPHKASAKRIRSGARTILYFYTPTCPACRTQDPIIRKIRKRYPDTVFRIDASTNQQAASAYGVVDVPHFAFIEGGKLVMTQAGAQREATIVAFLFGGAQSA